jgi:hypothetical protein
MSGGGPRHHWVFIKRCSRGPYNVREDGCGRLAPRNLFFDLVILADPVLQFSECWKAMRKLGGGVAERRRLAERG